MRPFAVLAAAVAFVAGASVAEAASPVFNTIDNPGDPTFNQLLGINNAGTIVGYFGSGMAGHPNQAYTIAAPYTRFLPMEVPGSVQTQVTGISSTGVVSGFWAPTNTGTDQNFGFIGLKEHGRFIYLDVNDPKVASSPEVNQVLGINASDIAVGFYNDANGNPHGFAYNALLGTLSPVLVGGAVSDAATGINNNNLICGFFTTPGGVTLGFLKPLVGGAAVKFGVPHSPTTQLLGVNSHGVAVGFYVGSDTFDHGVVYNPATGDWSTVDAPNGLMGTVLNGLNDKGEIVGFYTDAAGNVHGLLVTGWH
jgi:hypothetical protein